MLYSVLTAKDLFNADMQLLLAQGMLDSPVPFYHQNDLTSIPTTQPAWLLRVAPEARVHQARLGNTPFRTHC